MCDEYDDERMREFWRRLAMNEESPDLVEQPDVPIEPLEKSVGELAPPTNRKARALFR